MEEKRAERLVNLGKTPIIICKDCKKGITGKCKLNIIRLQQFDGIAQFHNFHSWKLQSIQYIIMVVISYDIFVPCLMSMKVFTCNSV